MPIAEKKIKQYFELPPQKRIVFYFTGKESTEDDKIYSDSIFSCTYYSLVERICPELQEIINGRYKALISLVGFSIEPIILSILSLHAQKVYLVYTKDSVKLCGIISKWTNQAKSFLNRRNNLQFMGIDEWHNSNSKYLVDGSDPVDVFGKIKRIIDSEIKGGTELREIALDITGGKKTMVSGAFNVANALGIDAFYVDFSEYDKGRGRPQPGSEFIIKLDNPDDIFRYSDMNRLEKLFDSFQFKEAISIADEMIKRMEKYKKYFTSELEEIHFIKDFGESYQYWDEYIYDEAKNKLPLNNNFLEIRELGSFFEGISKERPDKDITKIKEFYKKYQEKLFDDSQKFQFYIIDKYLNMERRIKQGNMQGAIVRANNILEILTYYYLYQNITYIESEKKIIQKNNLLMLSGLQSFSNRIELLVEKTNKSFVLKLNDTPFDRYKKEIDKINILRNSLSITHSIGSNLPVNSNDLLDPICSTICEVINIDKEKFSVFCEKMRFLTFSEVRKLSQERF